MSHNIMHNKFMVEIVRRHSISKCKERFITGDLHALRDDIQSRILQNFHERSTIRMILADLVIQRYSTNPLDLKDIEQAQKDLALTFIEGSEKEDLFWRQQLFDVENKINYHESSLFNHMHGSNKK